MNEELVLLGRRIAELRQARCLTQEQLSEIANYSTNHIAKLESARTNPSFMLLVNIAKALNVEMKDLFNFEKYISSEYEKEQIKKFLETKNKNKISTLYKIYRAIDL